MKYSTHIFIALILVIFYYVFYYTSIHSFEKKSFFYQNNDKFWAHRVLTEDEFNNSLVFNGVEIDLYFDSLNNYFLIKHDKIVNNQTLQDFLASVDNSKIFYWFDVKNLSSKNYKKSYDRFLFLDSLFKLNNRIIIESKNINYLSHFKNFNISYWLKDYSFFSSLFNINKIKSDLIKFRPNAISCDYKSVDFYSNKFPNYNLICWTNHMNYDKEKEQLSKIVSKKNVKIVLVNKEMR
tara:strand:+ start:211 stop:921 length:711 start_codon:yes stop_codon:yes gene_type:complete